MIDNNEEWEEWTAANWASLLTGEKYGVGNDFVATDEFRELMLLLKNNKDLLILVIGYRGMGKTTLLLKLARELEGYFIVWGGEQEFLSKLQELYFALVDDPVWNILIGLYKQLRAEKSKNDIQKIFEKNDETECGIILANVLRRGRGPHWKGSQEQQTVVHECFKIKDILFAALDKEARKSNLLGAFLDTYDTLLIDLPDYVVNNRLLLNKHLREIQFLWRTVEENLNIVLSIQEELSLGTFFEGKAIIIKLKPIPAQSLIDHFVFNFPENCFEDVALAELAFRSGGNFRRFKEYIRRCLTKRELLNKTTITKEDVLEWMGIEDAAKSFILQLSELFPRSKSNCELAAKIIEFIRANKEVAQPVIAKRFFFNESAADKTKALSNAYANCSRFLGKLDAKYLQCRKEGRTQIWSIPS